MTSSSLFVRASFFEKFLHFMLTTHCSRTSFALFSLLLFQLMFYQNLSLNSVCLVLLPNFIYKYYIYTHTLTTLMMVSLCKLPHWNIQLLVCSHQKIDRCFGEWNRVPTEKRQREREWIIRSQWNDVAKKMSILTRDQKPESYSNSIHLL